jgi:hypothetical protein
MTMQQVKINAYQAVKWVRHASKALYSNHPQLLVEGWHLGEDKVPAPSRADVATHVQVTAAASDAGDPEASASNDVVMQDAEVAPDTGFMAKLSRRLRGA